MRKKIISIMLCCILLLSLMPITTYAAVADPIVPMWDNTNTFTPILSFNGNTGSVTVTIVGKSGVSNITANVKLYYKNSSGTWIKSVHEWDYDVDQMFLTISESFIATPGRTYKIEVTATLTKNGVEEDISATHTATCPPSP